MPRRPRKISPTDRERFLEAVSSGSTITDAARRTGHHRQRFYELRGNDEEFDAQLTDALEAGTDALEAEAIRRAKDGWDEAVFGKGPDGHVVQVGVIRKYSDHLLIKLLAGRRPMYKDNPRVELQQAIAVKVEDRSASVEEMWKVLRNAGALEGGTAQATIPALEPQKTSIPQDPRSR
jgi:hypothetical protein